MSNPRLGAHLSLGPRPALSLERAAAEGVRCAQIFTSSPGAWKPPILRELKVADVREGCERYDINPVVIHAIYLINLASEDEALVPRSVTSLVAALEAGNALGARAVITHIGSHAGLGFDAAADRVAQALLRITELARGDTLLLLENSAGAGGIIGSRLEELEVLLDRARDHPRLGVALDTAHLCAAGWDFAGDAGAAAGLVSRLNHSIGLERLHIIHANDSRLPPGSRRDRHAIVGDGFIGIDGFRALLAQPALRRVPWILETPDLDIRLADAERWISLRRLLTLTEEMAIATC